MDNWKFPDVDGNPPEGLYVAVYRNGDSLPVALLSYGKWEFYDEDDVRDDADEDGMVRGFGWHEEAVSRHDDAFLFLREVVAYLPTDYSFTQPAMRALRSALTATHPTGGTEREG